MASLLGPGQVAGSKLLCSCSRQGQPSTSGQVAPASSNAFCRGSLVVRDNRWMEKLPRARAGVRALVEKNANSEPYFIESPHEGARADDHHENGAGLLLPPSEPIIATSASTKEATGVVSSPRAGLFRTPISGGVQSATTSHGLPSPATAARNLIEQARYAHLCTVMSRMHHRRKGYPFGSLVDYIVDADGHPVFSLSPLAIHTRNLLADPRCTLVVQIPGWSGLANARVTIFGDVYPLPPDHQEWAQQLHSSKHHQGVAQQWGNFYFYRMNHISDIYFVGGFGTVAWVDVNEYKSSKPDVIIANSSQETLQELNNMFSKPLVKLLAAEGGSAVDDACLISIDSKGCDVRVRQGARHNVQRLSFGSFVETLDEAVAALRRVIDNGPQH